MDRILKYTLWMITIILLQVLVFNKINIGGLVNPYIYPLFILMLPLETPPWLQMLIAFATGFMVDLLSGTFGMHAAAATILGFSRPVIVNLIAQNSTDSTTSPGIYQQGFGWFTGYTAILVLIHHLFYFFIEMGGFENAGITMLKILCSAIISISFIIMLELLFSASYKRKY